MMDEREDGNPQCVQIEFSLAIYKTTSFVFRYFYDEFVLYISFIINIE